MNADRLSDPLVKFTMINSGTVEFESFVALMACFEGLKHQLPLPIPVETMNGMATCALVESVQVHHEVDDHDWHPDVVYIHVETNLTRLDSDMIHFDVKPGEHPGSMWVRYNTRRVRMHNAFFAKEIYFIMFSDIVRSARIKRHKQTLALLMGTHRKNAPCAVQRFARHELSERQLFSLIKTFL